jgi:hypothetical protein
MCTAFLFRLRRCSGLRPGRRRPRCRPAFTPLEDRTLPSTFTVLNLNDSGPGSLRQAVLDANGYPGANQIVFASDLQGTIALTSGELDLSNDLTIAGPGAGRIAISGTNVSRVFNIAAGVTAEIDALTITQGRASQAGGINNAGSLTLSQCILSANVATTSSGTGGGGGVLNRGHLTISTSTLSGNSAGDDLGGAIANFGTLAIDHSTLTQSRGWNGGAVYNFSGSSLVLSDSTVSSNSSGFGGGILNDNGTVTIARSILANNSAFAGVCIDSCIPAPGLGGAIANIGGTVTVDSSSVANNRAEDNSGGGIYTYSTLVIDNSTITGNSANNGPVGYGGGIYVIYGGVSIANSTIAGNTASGRGGGIATLGAAPTARDTILADNQSPSGPDLSTYLASLGHNLIGNTQGGSGFDPTDLLNVDPLLGPLQDNGGPTQTMALLPGSPAIDAGDNTDAPMWDQRGPGFPRIIHGVIDIGAFEYRPPRQVQLDPNPVPDQGLGPPGPTSQPLLGPAQRSVDVAPAQSGGVRFQPGQPDTTLKPARTSAALRVQDVVLERWSDPVADVLAAL